jgi:hypothetical protein
MHRIAPLASSLLILAGLLIFAVAGPSALAEDAEATPPAAEAAQPACATPTALEDLSTAELTAWAEEGGMQLIPRETAAAASTPLCPDRRTCDPCQQGDGPCFLKEFGSNSCCVSPTGPCILCPEGTTIIVTTCPCVGSSSKCPRRDQDWQCG